MKIDFCAPLIYMSILCNAACHQISGDSPVNKLTDIEVIEQTIRNSIGWAKNKDFNLLYSVIVDDSNYLEIDPGNVVIRGINEFKRMESFWRNPDFKAVRYDIRDLDIQISRSGNVAWWYCILDDVTEWKGQPASWINTRWTGVMEKREAGWVIVQMHFSFAGK